MGWELLGVIALAWASQMYLAWRQSQRFMAEVRRLRRRGRVAVGRDGGGRLGRTRFAAVAADTAGRVVEVVTLSGITVFARHRTDPRWDGLPLERLVGLADDDDRLTRAVADAARTLRDAAEGQAPRQVEDPDDPAAGRPGARGSADTS